MRLLTKLMRLQAALAEVIDELADDQEVQTHAAVPRSPLASVQEEAEILLTRSAKNRRSDKNTVMTMAPLNGAPAVPESWKGRGVRNKGSGNKNRLVLAKIFKDYKPMTRVEIWSLSKDIDPRLKNGLQQKNFQQMVNRMLKLGKLRLKGNKLTTGV